MKYTSITQAKMLRDKYDCIIGWGAGGEYRKYYKEDNFLDYVVDSGEKGKGRVGKEINGNIIKTFSQIEKDIDNKKRILIVIFPNIEQEIINSINNVMDKKYDTIVARLIDFDYDYMSFSSNKEDIIMLELIKKLNKEKYSYLDLGVCHPIVRNNTYLFYGIEHMKGVLVEPNVEMCKLIKEYRESDYIINCGASYSKDSEELKYYYDNNNPGLNTFSEELAIKRNMENNYIKVPVKNINEIIKENFKNYPDILDIDTEGMDYEILSEINFDEFNIPIICAETNGETRFNELLKKYGYSEYARTKENTIFYKEA